MENLIKSQKEKLVELQEYLRVKEADLEKVCTLVRAIRCTVICIHVQIKELFSDTKEE